MSSSASSPTALFVLSAVFALLLLSSPSGRSNALPLAPEPDSQQQRQPSARVYYAALLRDANGGQALVPVANVPVYRLLSSVDAQHKKRRDLAAVAKKYDRNCFFSPVQCMLSFKDGSQSMSGNEEVLLGAGRRR